MGPVDEVQVACFGWTEEVYATTDIASVRVALCCEDGMYSVELHRHGSDISSVVRGRRVAGILGAVYTMRAQHVH